MSASVKQEFVFEVNGKEARVKAHSMARLLDVLREDLGLTGAKEGCGEGECGACSVFVNGRIVNSCLVPIAQMRGAKIETVESLSQAGSELDALQKSFLKHGGAQCGICTPGMLIAGTALLRKIPHPTPEQAREALAGNLCRCTGYNKIIDAVCEALQ